MRCLRSRIASGERERLPSFDLSLHRRSRERERSRLLCLSRDRSRLRSLSASLSFERSRRLSFDRSRFLSTDLSLLLLSFDRSRRLSLERSLCWSLDLSRLRSRASSRGFLYGSGDPSRPRLLALAAAGLLALAAGEASLGLRSLERSLGFRSRSCSRDLLLDRRRDVTEGSLLAGFGSLLAGLSCTTRGGVGTSPLASC